MASRAKGMDGGRREGGSRRDLAFADLERATLEVAVRSLSHRAEEPGGGRDPDGSLTAAGVAVVLSPDAMGRASVLLTRRAAHLSRHAGQWAFPGGRVDGGESFREAALRELEEEVGVVLGRDAVLGRLDDFVTRSGFLIRPVLCWSPRTPDPRPDPAEVESAHLVAVSSFDRPDVPILRPGPEGDEPLLALPLGEGLIHAPTAAILYQLVELLLHGRVVRVAHYEQPRFAWS